MATSQRVGFCRTSDGVRIAYGVHGDGPPLVKVAHWMTHLEHDWHSPVWHHWLAELGSRRTVIRYDSRETGLSDRTVAEVSLNAWVADLEAVVDAAGVDRFPLFAMCQAGPVAIEYAARHPDRVSELVLYGTYAVGRFRRGSAAGREDAHATLTLMRSAWSAANPWLRRSWGVRFMPGASDDQLRWFDGLQEWSATTDAALRHMRVRYDVDVTEQARTLAVPTLVLHPRDDAVVPLELGLQLAALIPHAQMVTLDSANHLLMEDEPAWHVLLAQLDTFLGTAQGPGPPESNLDHLSGREGQVLRLVATGLSNKEIAAQLHLSERTVERHLSNAYTRLGLSGRGARAAGASLISPGSAPRW